MTMIVTKSHFGSDIYKTLDDELLGKMHIFAKKVGNLLNKSLGKDRCIQIMEGFDIDHSHIKLYPVTIGKFVNIQGEDVLGDEEELKKVADIIRK